jgi:hypothetical protein
MNPGVMEYSFEEGRVGLLFFSRGRGRGHAIPDMAIGTELARLCPRLDIRFVSYGTGASTFSEFGHQVIPLGVPEANSFLETLVRASALISGVRPKIILSHEELAILPAARIHGISSLFITDWFPSQRYVTVADDPHSYTDQIVFMQDRGLFDEPPSQAGKIDYIGPVGRPMAYTKADFARARQELGISQDAKVITVIPGAWATEERAPLAALVVEAFDALRLTNKRLLWVAGADYEALQARFANNGDILVIRSCWPIEQVMVASDLAITKNNRGTIFDLASLGVPSLSISYGLNPIDDIIVPRIQTNRALRARGVDSEHLASLMNRTLENAGRAATPIHMTSPALAAVVLSEHIDRLMKVPSQR